MKEFPGCAVFDGDGVGEKEKEDTQYAGCRI